MIQSVPISLDIKQGVKLLYLWLCPLFVECLHHKVFFLLKKANVPYEKLKYSYVSAVWNREMLKALDFCLSFQAFPFTNKDLLF